MNLIGSGSQFVPAHLFDASGTIASGGTAQLIIPIARCRSSLIFENISDTDMLIDVGSGRATATLTTGTVSSCSVTNAGFGFSRPPIITFLGGGWISPAVIPTYTIAGLPCWSAPTNPNASTPARVAQAHCVMSGNAPNQTIGSIVMDDPGAGYLYPPYVFLSNDPLDPYGCAIPSATVGILLKANGGNYTANGTVTITDQISVFCATTGKAFTCKYTV